MHLHSNPNYLHISLGIKVGQTKHIEQSSYFLISKDRKSFLRGYVTLTRTTPATL